MWRYTDSGILLAELWQDAFSGGGKGDYVPVFCDPMAVYILFLLFWRMVF